MRSEMPYEVSYGIPIRYKSYLNMSQIRRLASVETSS
jgi:hypothetical protein